MTALNMLITSIVKKAAQQGLGSRQQAGGTAQTKKRVREYPQIHQ